MTYLSDKRGFTLIELIMVLAVIALAASITAISIGRTSQKALIRDEASLLQGALRLARQESLFSRTPVFFVLEPEDGTYAVLRGEAEVRERHQVPASLMLTGSQEIAFFPKGNSTGGSVTLSGPAGRSYLIEVDHVTGIAKLQRL